MDSLAETADIAPLEIPDRDAATGNSGKGDAPLKVCHLGKFYPPASGGIETHLRMVARAQAEGRTFACSASITGAPTERT